MAAPRATIALTSVSFVLVFAGFRWNLWQAAEGSFFALNQHDAEALVLGRMVMSRERGLFAGSGLLGFVGTGPAVVTFDTTELWGSQSIGFQSQAYLQGIPIQSFSPYFSHSGLNGIALASLDRVLSRAPPAFKLSLFRTLTSALVAAAFTLLVLWLRRELGFGAALFSLFVLIASPWLAAFARNFYWSLWLFLLPTLGIGAVLSSRPERSGQNRWLGIVAFGTLLVRFLSGYEFGTLTGMMAAAPVLYYSIRDTQPLRVLLGRLGILAGAALAALIVSLAALTLQIADQTGSARNAIAHIRFGIGRRTSGDPSKFPPVYSAALQATSSGVLERYLGDRFDRRYDSKPPRLFRWLAARRYGELTLWILLAAGWVAARTAWRPAARRYRPLALAAATLCTLFGTLAWLVLFKAHSFHHFHVNPLMWHLVFLPLGGAVVWLAVADATLLIGRAFTRFSARRRRTG